MSDAMSISAAGLLNSQARVNADASAVVQATSPDSASDGLENAIVALKTDAVGFKADAAVFRAADKMRGTLLDLLV
jgi:hypothetical protein